MKTLYVVPHNAMKIVEITDYSFTGNIVFYGPNDGWPNHRYALPPKSGKSEYGTYFDTLAEAEKYRISARKDLLRRKIYEREREIASIRSEYEALQKV